MGICNIPEDRIHYVLDNMKLVHYCVRRLYPSYDEYEDYVQEGMIGLCLAAARFDESKGFAFTTFASSYIYGMIKKYKRDNTLVSEPRWIKDLRYKIISYTIEHPEATDEEICEALNISESNYLDYKILEDYQSLDAVIEGKDGGTITVGEMIPDNSSLNEIFNIIEIESFTKAKNKVFDTMHNQLYKDIYDDFFYSNIYGDKIGQRELAAKYKVSQAHISRLLRFISKKILDEYRGKEK